MKRRTFIGWIAGLFAAVKVGAHEVDTPKRGGDMSMPLLLPTEDGAEVVFHFYVVNGAEEWFSAPGYYEIYHGGHHVERYLVDGDTLRVRGPATVRLPPTPLVSDHG